MHTTYAQDLNGRLQTNSSNASADGTQDRDAHAASAPTASSQARPASPVPTGFQKVCWECKRGYYSAQKPHRARCRDAWGHTGPDWSEDPRETGVTPNVRRLSAPSVMLNGHTEERKYVPNISSNNSSSSKLLDDVDGKAWKPSPPDRQDRRQSFTMSWWDKTAKVSAEERRKAREERTLKRTEKREELHVQAQKAREYKRRMRGDGDDLDDDDEDEDEDEDDDDGNLKPSGDEDDFSGDDEDQEYDSDAKARGERSKYKDVHYKNGKVHESGVARNHNTNRRSKEKSRCTKRPRDWEGDDDGYADAKGLEKGAKTQTLPPELDKFSAACQRAVECGGLDESDSDHALAVLSACKGRHSGRMAREMVEGLRRFLDARMQVCEESEYKVQLARTALHKARARWQDEQRARDKALAKYNELCDLLNNVQTMASGLLQRAANADAQAVANNVQALKDEALKGVPLKDAVDSFQQQVRHAESALKAAEGCADATPTEAVKALVCVREILEDIEMEWGHVDIEPVVKRSRSEEAQEEGDANMEDVQDSDANADGDDDGGIEVNDDMKHGAAAVAVRRHADGSNGIDGHDSGSEGHSADDKDEVREDAANDDDDDDGYDKQGAGDMDPERERVQQAAVKTEA
jgi:hypothetical protein